MPIERAEQLTLGAELSCEVTLGPGIYRSGVSVNEREGVCVLCLSRQVELPLRSTAGEKGSNETEVKVDD